MLINRCFHFHRICSTTTTFVDIRRKFFFRSLFNHFQFAKNAEKEMKKRGIDLNNLTAEQRIKLKPLYRMKNLFQVINVVMGSMGLIAFYVWFSRKKSSEKENESIEETFQPIWFNLKSFKQKAALIHRFLLPEQIVSKLNPLKSFEFRSNDVICSSFPKSGTTLLQELVFLIENNFNFDLVSKKDLSDRFHFLEWPTTNLQHLSQQSTTNQRFIKTHLPPVFFNDSFRKAKIIYIYRNPKDVCVSLFHFLRSINIELTYSGSWNQFNQSFLLDEVYYAPWSEHMNEYFSLGSNVCCVAYEDLLTDFRPTVRRIAKYLGKEDQLTEDKLDQLEKWCSFESMKKNPRVNYSWMNQYGFVKNSFQFFRKGQIGDWLNHFDVQQSRSFDEMIEKRLSPSIPSFNFGISRDQQEFLYQFDQKRNSSNDQIESK